MSDPHYAYIGFAFVQMLMVSMLGLAMAGTYFIDNTYIPMWAVPNIQNLLGVQAVHGMILALFNDPVGLVGMSFLVWSGLSLWAVGVELAAFLPAYENMGNTTMLVNQSAIYTQNPANVISMPMITFELVMMFLIIIAIGLHILVHLWCCGSKIMSSPRSKVTTTTAPPPIPQGMNTCCPNMRTIDICTYLGFKECNSDKIGDTLRRITALGGFTLFIVEYAASLMSLIQNRAPWPQLDGANMFLYMGITIALAPFPQGTTLRYVIPSKSPTDQDPNKAPRFAYLHMICFGYLVTGLAISWMQINEYVKNNDFNFHFDGYVQVHAAGSIINATVDMELAHMTQYGGLLAAIAGTIVLIFIIITGILKCRVTSKQHV